MHSEIFGFLAPNFDLIGRKRKEKDETLILKAHLKKELFLSKYLFYFKSLLAL